MIPSVNELNRIKFDKKLKEDKIYKNILKQCVDLITYTNNCTKYSFTVFQVPLFVSSEPSYNIKHCIIYIVNKFREHKYIVEFIEPNYLYLDWGVSGNPKGNQEVSRLIEKYKHTHDIQVIRR